jgi:hypothetical protein
VQNWRRARLLLKVPRVLRVAVEVEVVARKALHLVDQPLHHVALAQGVVVVDGVGVDGNFPLHG